MGWGPDPEILADVILGRSLTFLVYVGFLKSGKYINDWYVDSVRKSLKPNDILVKIAKNLELESIFYKSGSLLNTHTHKSYCEE